MAKGTVKRELPVTLTVTERIERGLELAVSELERNRAQQNYDAEASDWKDERKGWETRIEALSERCLYLAKVVNTGEEVRAVVCEVLVRDGVYVLVRTDTGEVVTTRPATSEEMQLELPVVSE